MTKYAVLGVVASLLISLMAMAAQPDDLFQQAHRALVRIVSNEAGTKSVPDADGITEALSTNARHPDGAIDLRRFLLRMVNHSPRTFPLDSPWRVSYRDPRKLRYLDKLRTPRNGWSSKLELNCEEPPGYPDKWNREACFKLVDVTRKLLRGEMVSRCDERPTTWGSCTDVNKLSPGSKLRTVSCDRVRSRVPGNSINCEALRADCTQAGRHVLYNTPECSKNTFLRYGR